jgi:hypothetical protein
MSARILVHPKVATTAALGQILALFLEGLGYDMSRIAVFQAYSARKSPVFELVREVGVNQGHTVYRRMDGAPFKHYHSGAPEAA